MKQLLIGSVLSLAVAAPLSAQAHERECFDKGSLRYFECPALPVVLVDDVAADFSGFYAGATAGFAGAEVSGRFDSGGINDADIVNLDTTADGFAFGGYIGYMHQFENNIVLGVEIDGSIADLTAKADADPVAGDPEVVEASVDYMASARIRLGYAFDQFMPYVTAGVGLVGYEHVFKDQYTHATTSNPLNRTSQDDVAFGGVFGGGLEYKMTDDVSFRVEGLYYAVESKTDLAAGSIDDADSGDFGGIGDVWTVRAGVSFHF